MYYIQHMLQAPSVPRIICAHIVARVPRVAHALCKCVNYYHYLQTLNQNAYLRPRVGRMITYYTHFQLLLLFYLDFKQVFSVNQKSKLCSLLLSVCACSMKEKKNYLPPYLATGFSGWYTHTQRRILKMSQNPQDFIVFCRCVHKQYITQKSNTLLVKPLVTCWLSLF